VLKKDQVFWSTRPCRLVKRYRRFGRARWLHHQGQCNPKGPWFIFISISIQSSLLSYLGSKIFAKFIPKCITQVPWHEMQSSVHAVFRRFISFLHFPLGRPRGGDCIHRNKQTQITQKEGPESIAFRDISRCSAGLAAAMCPPLCPAEGAQPTRVLHVHAMTHAERKKLGEQPAAASSKM
jgi:hypothetical protein